MASKYAAVLAEHNKSEANYACYLMTESACEDQEIYSYELNFRESRMNAKRQCLAKAEAWATEHGIKVERAGF